MITDEYNEVFADPIYGPKFRRLYLRIARVGPVAARLLEARRPKTRTPRTCATSPNCWVQHRRTSGTEEESRLAIGDARAAHIAPSGEEGTAYLRVGLREARKFRYFYSSGDFTPGDDDSGDVVAAPKRAAPEFMPRLFTAEEAVDVDGKLTAQPARDEGSVVPLRRVPAEAPVKMVTAVTESLQRPSGGQKS